MGKEERFNFYINKKDDRDWFIDDRLKEEEITTFKDVVEVLNQKTRQIADLEAKLAESKKKIKGFVELFDKKQHENYEQFCEIQQLKQQLAESENTACKNLAELTKIATEKDRKIEELKQQLAEKEFEIKKLNTRILVSQLQAPEEQRLKIIGSSCCQYNPNQDKISFTLEQLEKVKNEFFDISNGWWLCFRDGTQYMTHRELEGCVEEVIDNKIKQLKDGK